MTFIHDDGGRALAGYTGKAGDCVTRAIAIAAQLPYQQVYDAIAACNASYKGRKGRGAKSARNGAWTQGVAFKRYMASIGWVFVPTMRIGSGCTVHLHDGELPMGRLIVSVSKHYTAVIYGVIHDTHNPQREINVITPDRGQPMKPGDTRNINGICSVSRRCVYGYWIEEKAQRSAFVDSEFEHRRNEVIARISE
jgi:hypothetical protein